MGLYFRNSTPNTVYVAFAYIDSACFNEGLDSRRKKGWYQVLPGQTSKVWTGWAGGKYFWFYAEDDAGHTWSGTDFTPVPDDAFNLCWNIGCSTCTNVGFQMALVTSIFDVDKIINLRLASNAAWLNPKIFQKGIRRKLANRLRRSLPARLSPRRPLPTKRATRRGLSRSSKKCPSCSH